MSIITIGTTTLFAAGYLTEKDGSSNTVYVDDQGSIGIGTTTPESALHISGLDYTLPEITLEHAGSDYYIGVEYGFTGSYSLGVNDSFYIYNNTTKRYEINIGRGSTQMSGRLTVAKNITAYGDIASRRHITANGNISSTGAITAAGDITSSGLITAANYACTSDLRYKENITPIQSALTKVLSLNGVTYNWKQDQFKEKNFNGEKQIGFIAQDVEKVIPEVVHTAKDGYKAISYNKITTVLVEAIKELKKGTDTRISSLQKENDELRKRVAALERVHKRIARLELKVNKIKDKR